MTKFVADRPSRYHLFILSLWEEPGRTSPQHSLDWRFSLENPHTAERIGFKNLAELTHFLDNWTNHLPENQKKSSHT